MLVYLHTHTYIHKKNTGPIRRFPDGEINPQLAFDGCYTIYELFRRSVSIYGHRPFLGHRPIDSEGKAAPYVFQTYEEAAVSVCVCVCVCVFEEDGGEEGLLVDMLRV
jgi:hypothetical protein